MELLQKILGWVAIITLSVMVAMTIFDRPQSIDQLAQQGSVAHIDGNYGRAEQVWWQILQRQPRREDAYVGLGDALLAQERYQEATLAFQRVRALFPNHAWRYSVKLGDALVGAGQLNNAIMAYQQALKGRDPDYPDFLVKSIHAKAHMGLGNVLQQQGQTQKAAAEYISALTLEPTLTQAQEKLKELGVTSPIPKASPSPQPTPSSAATGLPPS